MLAQWLLGCVLHGGLSNRLGASEGNKRGVRLNHRQLFRGRVGTAERCQEGQPDTSNALTKNMGNSWRWFRPTKR